MPEEEAFVVLVQMMNGLNLRELFKPNMTELGLCIYQLECLIQVTPDLTGRSEGGGGVGVGDEG